MGATASIAMAFPVLRERLAAIDNEQKRLDAEAQAINLLLEKHAGSNPSSSHVARSANGQPSIAKLVYKALTEAGKPQSTAQLLAFLSSHGRTVNNSTLRSTIHQGKLFKSVTPGVYGLKE